MKSTRISHTYTCKPKDCVDSHVLRILDVLNRKVVSEQNRLGGKVVVISLSVLFCEPSPVNPYGTVEGALKLGLVESEVEPFRGWEGLSYS